MGCNSESVHQLNNLIGLSQQQNNWVLNQNVNYLTKIKVKTNTLNIVYWWSDFIKSYKTEQMTNLYIFIHQDIIFYILNEEIERMILQFHVCLNFYT